MATETDPDMVEAGERLNKSLDTLIQMNQDMPLTTYKIVEVLLDPMAKAKVAELMGEDFEYELYLAAILATAIQRLS
jgi:hypothetical protein